MRAPDFVIGPADTPYMHRWYLIPRNPVCNVYLHRFVRDDEDRALHDHPWPSVSFVLKGGYYELTKGPDGTLERRWYGPGSVIFRGPRYSHRVELARGWHPDGKPIIPCTTLFLTGPRVREWGFHCPGGWIPWQQFCKADEPGQIGKGCP